MKVFEYEAFPKEFRVKLDYALSWALRPFVEYSYEHGHSPVQDLGHFLAEEHARYDFENRSLGELVLQDYTVVLDLIEATWVLVAERDAHSAEALTAKINDLFAEYGLGYKLHDGQVLRVDTPVLTELAIEPALTLLSERGFEQAEKEFHDAVHHLRSNNPGDAVMWANAAFESTMKVILRARKVAFDEKNDTAKPLIRKVLAVPGLVPPHLSSYANNLAEVFQGLPTFRNRTPPAHGQGTSPSSMDREDAQFALNLAATFIVFLAGRHRSLKR